MTPIVDRPGDGAHERHESSAAPYLLGALADLEIQAYERHLMGCELCRDEVEGLRPAAEALPRAVAQISPPPALRRSLMRTVHRDVARSRPSLRERARDALAPGAVRLRPVLAWTSAAVLLLGGAFAGYGVSTLGNGGSDGRVVAATVDGSRAAEGSASLTIANAGNAVLSVHGMPTLPAKDSTDVYQLWLVRGAEVIPGAVFSVGADGSGAAAVTGDLRGVDRLWVTREGAGGARAPTEKPLIGVELS